MRAPQVYHYTHLWVVWRKAVVPLGGGYMYRQNSMVCHKSSTFTITCFCGAKFHWFYSRYTNLPSYNAFFPDLHYSIIHWLYRSHHYLLPILSNSRLSTTTPPLIDAPLVRTVKHFAIQPLLHIPLSTVACLVDCCSLPNCFRVAPLHRTHCLISSINPLHVLIYSRYFRFVDEFILESNIRADWSTPLEVWLFYCNVSCFILIRAPL